MNIHQLRQARDDARAKGAGLVETIRGEDRKPTEDENAELESYRQDVAEAEARLADAETMQQFEREFAPIASSPIEASPDALEALLRERGREALAVETHGFANMADFATAVRTASLGATEIDPRLKAQPTGFHKEGGDDSGVGYLVPPAFRDQIFELVFSDASVLSFIDLEPTERNAVTAPIDETTPWGASGVQAKWRAEASQMEKSKLQIGNEYVTLHQLYAFVLATDELLEDAPRLSNRLTTKAAQAIRWKASDAIYHGTGAGMPHGIMKSKSLVTVAKESGQAAATVNAQNIAKMFARLVLTAGSLARARWAICQDLFPQLITMTLGNSPIWTPPATGMVGAPAGLLLGRPIDMNEHMEAPGKVGDIMFADYMGYYAAQKSRGGDGIKFDRSIHLYFDYGMEAFRWTFRLGGQPYLSKPVESAKAGVLNKSHFVTLAVR